MIILLKIIIIFNVSLIKYFKKKIPSFRHRKELFIPDYNPIFHINTKKIKNILYVKRKKKFYKNKFFYISKKHINLNTLVTKKFIHQLKPYKKFILCETYYNFDLIIPGIEKLPIGKILFNLKFSKQTNVNSNYRNFYKGFITYLSYIPEFSVFCNVTNINNTKITYAKSGGTFCILKKNKKSKKKLILIILPSKQSIYLNKMSKVYLGKNTNFSINSLIEGKWGFSFHLSKKIKVRGVAMNPVDHPNGGRTKTVQPEKSPWNWVAKKKK